MITRGREDSIASVCRVLTYFSPVHLLARSYCRVQKVQPSTEAISSLLDRLVDARVESNKRVYSSTERPGPTQPIGKNQRLNRPLSRAHDCCVVVVHLAQHFAFVPRSCYFVWVVPSHLCIDHRYILNSQGLLRATTKQH